jgi:hypothetical protein
MESWRATFVSMAERAEHPGTILVADRRSSRRAVHLRADTVALGPVALNSIRASIVLASPTSGHFSARCRVRAECKRISPKHHAQQGHYQ